VSWRAVEPGPFRAWARWAPRTWPSPPDPYLDLAAQSVVWPSPEEAEATSFEGAPDRVPSEPGATYLPPVGAGLREMAAALEQRLVVDGGVPVSHRFATGPFEPGAPGLDFWLDPLAAWWRGQSVADWTAIAVAAGAAEARVALAWPLVAGWAPVGEALAVWLEGLRPLRPRCVVGVAVSLPPGGRRRLVERLGEASFEEVFHSRPMSEHEFASAACGHGFEPLPPRPRALAGAPRSQRNFELAAVAREAAELSQRLGFSEAECAAMLAAARHIEVSGLDVAAVAREGNLPVVDWLPPAVRELIAEWVADGRSRRLDDLRRSWCGETTE